MSEAMAAAIKQRRMTFVNLWAVLTASVVGYVFVGHGLAGAPGVEPQAVPPDFATALYVIAAILAGLAFLIPRVLLSDGRITRVLERDPDPERMATDRLGIVHQPLLEILRPLTPAERRTMAVVWAFFTPFVVRLALTNSIVIFGLILTILGREPASIYPFAAVALVLNALAFPRINDLLERTASLAQRAGVG